MCNNRLKFTAATGENDSIRTWTSTRVCLVALQDREFVVRATVRKIEALAVVVDMWVVLRANLLAVPQVVATLVDGFVDVGLVVAS